MTSQLSPSPLCQSCGRAVAVLRGTGYQSRGVLKGTGWWTSCAGRSVVAQPSERWTGTGQERERERDTSLQLSGLLLNTHFCSALFEKL